MTVKCPMCGAEIVPDVQQCENCGERVYSSLALWSDREKTLVMHEDAVFPDRCVKTNRPAQGARLRQRVVWFPPVLFLWLIGGPLFFLGLYLLVKRVRFRYGILPEILQRRERNVRIYWSLIVLGLVLVCVPLSLASLAKIDYEFFPVLYIAGALLIVSGALYGYLTTSHFMYMVKLQGPYLWMKGASTEFLAELPAWPGREIADRDPPPVKG